MTGATNSRLRRHREGLMPRDEGLALFEFALAHGERSHRGTWLEIGRGVAVAVYLVPPPRHEPRYLLPDHHHAAKRTRPAGEHSFIYQ